MHLKTLEWVINWDSEDSVLALVLTKLNLHVKFACVTDRVNCFICKTKVQNSGSQFWLQVRITWGALKNPDAWASLSTN